MKMLKQADMCLLQMEQLHESVSEYAPVADHMFVAGYYTQKNAQANRTAIKRQITSLRQSLLALEKEIYKCRLM